jgi:hypothetical protein
MSSLSLYAIFFLGATLPFAAAAPHNFTARDVGFRADPAANIGGIFDAALGSTQDPLAVFPPNAASSASVQIFGDWLNLGGVSAFYFFADMDVDCDGVVRTFPTSDLS